MARVTAIVLTADAREALFATIESILAQTYQDLDLVIADDGSTDGTGPELLTRFGPNAARAAQVWRETLREGTGTRSIQMIRGGTLIHYLHQVSTRGVGTAWNRAIGFATGDLLAFGRAGDLWKQRKLQNQLDLLEANVLFEGCVEPCSEKKGTKKSACRTHGSLNSISFEDVLHCTGLRLNGALLRRSCLEGGEPPFDENMPGCEEYDFWLRVGTRHALGRQDELFQSHTATPEVKEWGQSRFRVYALEKAYQGGHLSSTMRHRVAEELVRQCDLLVEGYRERENCERANFYDRKRKRFFQEVAKLDVSDPAFTRPTASRSPASRSTGRALTEASA